MARRIFLAAAKVVASFVLVPVLLLASETAAYADEQGDLDKGRNAYLTRQYDEAAARFKTMLDPKTGTLHDPVLITQASMYWGAVMIAKQRPKDASALFEQLLLKDPHYEPDPLSFPTDVLDVFSDTRNRIRARLNAAAQEQARREADKRARDEAEKKRQIERVAMLERLASEEKTTERHARFIAFLPFGAGQFQNHQPVTGWIFFGVEAAFVITGTIAVPLFFAEVRSARELYVESNGFHSTQAQAATDRANGYRILNLASYGAFLVTAVVGIVQANAKYEPELVLTRKRTPLPASGAMWKPTLAPLTNEHGATGGVVGIEGRF
jgi:hypothetical protein